MRYGAVLQSVRLHPRAARKSATAWEGHPGGMLCGGQRSNSVARARLSAPACVSPPVSSSPEKRESGSSASQHHSVEHGSLSGQRTSPSSISHPNLGASRSHPTCTVPTPRRHNSAARGPAPGRRAPPEYIAPHPALHPSRSACGRTHVHRAPGGGGSSAATRSHARRSAGAARGRRLKQLALQPRAWPVERPEIPGSSYLPATSHHPPPTPILPRQRGFC